MNLEEIIDSNNYDLIGSSVKKFAKTNKNPSDSEISKIKKLLENRDYYVRESAVYALFFMWGLTDEKLVNKALRMAINENEDFDVRKWLFSSFPKIYEKTQDKRIPQCIYNVFRFSQDELVRKSSLKSLLGIYGLESEDILLREVKNRVHFEKGNIEDRIKLFSDELSEIEKIIKEIKK